MWEQYQQPVLTMREAMTLTGKGKRTLLYHIDRGNIRTRQEPGKRGRLLLYLDDIRRLYFKSL